VPTIPVQPDPPIVHNLVTDATPDAGFFQLKLSWLLPEATAVKALTTETAAVVTEAGVDVAITEVLTAAGAKTVDPVTLAV